MELFNPLHALYLGTYITRRFIQFLTVQFFSEMMELAGLGLRYTDPNFRFCTRLRFFLKNWANPGLFLFIFVLFNNNFTEKIVDFSGNRTRIVGVEGEHADH